jgi:hypothetical protein
MKKTILTIVATAVLTWFVCGVIEGLHRGVAGLWLISAIKVPGNKAIADIQTDMNEGRYELARAKLQVFRETWQRFDRGPDSCDGKGIGDVMVAFSKIQTNEVPERPEQSAAELRSQTREPAP